MTKLNTLTVRLSIALALVLAVGPVTAATPDACFLIVSEKWPQSSNVHPGAVARARNHLFDEFGILIDAAYRNGGYSRNPASFPVHHTDFRGDHIIVDFRTSCGQARLFLSELLGAYRSSLSAEQRETGPSLTIEDRPATEYEVQCGIGATAATCSLDRK